MSNKRSCNKYDRMIDDYIDGLLSEKEIKKLEAHLAECEECRASLRFSLALREITSASAEKIPQEVHDKILSETGARGRRRQLIRRGTLAVACALIFVASVAAWAMLPGRQKTNDVPPENIPVAQSTREETIASSSSEAPASPAPEIQEPAEDTLTVEEECVPGEPAVETETDKSDKEMFEVTEAEEATMALPDTNEAAEATEASPETYAEPDAAPPVAESLGAASPGGEDITLALLIVSGLLAVASFIAFLISLSSARRIPSKKDKE